MFPVKQPPQARKSHFQSGDKVKKEESSEVICYGCGTPGVIKPKCPSCKGKDKRNHRTFSSVILQSASCPSKHLATLGVTNNGVIGTACTDTAATHSIAGETLPYFEETRNNLLNWFFYSVSGRWKQNRKRS
ncbi:hypothetical protein NPIL_107201 [Nephila pilipes]|uniref:Uncharacterized protein n=1 Tax=Nephila pilipes TaxID=299642 RepID=A0A8X6Q6V2_NEPPI|nr:hypothetical protein NPIL_107201 [Nephila pilipes]